MTFGPDSHWRQVWYPIGNWCIQNGFEEVFKLLIIAFNFYGSELKVLAFKNVIDILSEEQSILTLESWASNGDQISQSLLDLTIAINHSTDPVFHKLERASFEITKALPKDKYFFLNLFLKKQTSHKKEQSDWVRTLRLWLLIHVIYRVKRNVYFDKDISKASSFISDFIFQKKFDWKNLMQIQPHTKPLDFSIFNFELIQHISPLQITLKENKRLKLFMGAIERIVSDIDKKESGLNEVVSTQSEIKDIGLFVEPTQTFVPNDDDKYWLPLTPIKNTSNASQSSDSYATAKVDDKQSYIHQELSIKSLFITYDEYKHLLPWSWNRLTAIENNDLLLWINNQFKHDHLSNEALPFLATITWLALKTGRSLVRALEFSISDKPKQEWTYVISIQKFVRITPSRTNSWLPKTDLEKLWVNERAEYNTINLPPNIQTFLQTTIEKYNNKPNSLRELWNLLISENIEVYFNKNMPTALKRIRSGMLANSLKQEVFERSSNPNLAQMTAYHPQVALTGTYAYAEYSCAQTAKSTTEIHKCLDQNFSAHKNNVIAMGSYCSPKEELLKEAISNATQKILDIDINIDPIKYHNFFSAYLVTSIWSSTGARPVLDSFESPKHFNLENGFVYINDKAVDERHKGRLAPLAMSLTRYLSKNYKQHLTYLAQSLLNSAPLLAKEITLLIEDQPSGKLPYFFFINSKSLDWKSISPSGIDKLDLFEWPLRHNLFRQRLAKILPKSGIDQSIVDAWLGHKDNRIDLYGDYSLSCLIKDINENRTRIEDAFNSLGFIQLATWNGSPTIKATSKATITEKPFGIKKRFLARKENQNKLIKNAKTDLGFILRNKKVNDLTQTDVDDIEKKLSSTPDGQFHPHALLRMGVFSDFIDDLWKTTGERFKVKHRYLKINDQSNPISEWGSEHYMLYPQLKNEFLSQYSKIHASKTSINDARIWSVIALIFENRLCNISMLEDIFNQKNFRLVKFRTQYYLEYSESIELDDVFSPVQRHLLSAKTAKLLHHLIGTKKPKFIYPPQLQPFLNSIKKDRNSAITKDFKYYLKRLCTITNNANSIELQGTLSAYLSGRVTSCSLNWIDWVRLSSNKRIQVPDKLLIHKKPSKLDSILNSEISKFNSSAIGCFDNEALLISAKRFNDDIRDVLVRYKKSSSQTTVKALKKIINKHRNLTSSTMTLLGEWIIDLIKKGKNNKKSFKAYATSSPNNYFSTLSNYFEQLAYNKDIITMDEDDVTDLYNDFLTATKDLKGKHHSDRLLSFHQFATSKGVTEPDWDDLELPKKTWHVSPGIISEKDYFTALKIIIGNGIGNDITTLHMSFLLIVFYRFGLRSKEAIYLLRRDWVEKNGSVYLLIRNNRYRKLKNSGSKRIVPLLFKLSTDEHNIIKSVLAYYDANHHTDDSKCLLSLDGDTINQHIPAIRSSLILLLKQVTANPKFVNHHLRHSFDNIISLSLYKIDLPLFKNLITHQKPTFNNINSTILGSQHNNLNTRNPMAVARMLGHTHSHTDAVSYQHFQGEWANQIHPELNIKTKIKLNKAIDLDSFKTAQPVSISLIDKAAMNYRATSITNILRYFSLIALGRNYEEACNLLSIDPQHITKLKKLIMAFEDKQNKTSQNSDDLGFCRPKWLVAIPSTAWKNLIELAEKTDSQTLMNTDNMIELDRIIEMVGQKRQLTLWLENQFSNVQKFIDHFNIPRTCFEVHSYIGANQNPLADLSSHFGFPIDENLKKRKDLDPGLSIDMAVGSFQSRINFIFKEDKNFPMKTSYQMVALFLAYFSSGHLIKK